MTFPSLPDRRHAFAALAFALVIGGGLSWCRVHMPLTVHDGVAPILQAQRSPSAWATFVAGLSQQGYLRPLRMAQIKIAFDLAGGHELGVYTAIHCALTLAACALFATLLAPATLVELVAAVLAITIFIGHHSFFMLVGEGYPINHFLEIVVLALFVAALAKRGTGRDQPAGTSGVARPPRSGDGGVEPAVPVSDGSWWADALALVALVAALLTLESGVLVWVVLVAARTLGWRGISKRCVVLATIAVVAFFIWRLGVLHVGGPGLSERSSGMWLRRLERDELMARFSSNPLPFYAYNVASAVATVLFSEPRVGVFVLVAEWLKDDVQPWMIMHVLSSAVVTVVIAAVAVPAIRRACRRQGSDRDRLICLGLVMVIANAALSYGYLKDEILSVGAAFYAAAAYAALSACGDRLTRAGNARLALVAVPVLFVASTLWTVRAVGTFYGLRSFAEKTKDDWIAFSLERELPADAAYAQSRQLFDRLRWANLQVRVPNNFYTDEHRVERIIEIR